MEEEGSTVVDEGSTVVDEGAAVVGEGSTVVDEGSTVVEVGSTVVEVGSIEEDGEDAGVDDTAVEDGTMTVSVVEGTTVVVGAGSEEILYHHQQRSVLRFHSTITNFHWYSRHGFFGHHWCRLTFDECRAPGRIQSVVRNVCRSYQRRPILYVDPILHGKGD